MSRWLSSRHAPEQHQKADASKTQTTERDSRILGGDFNATSWPELFYEWTQEQGIWELVDPSIPTITSGGKRDKLLLAPVLYAPPDPMRREDTEGGVGGGHVAALFPASCVEGSGAIRPPLNIPKDSSRKTNSDAKATNTKASRVPD